MPEQNNAIKECYKSLVHTGWNRKYHDACIRIYGADKESDQCIYDPRAPLTGSK